MNSKTAKGAKRFMRKAVQSEKQKLYVEAYQALYLMNLWDRIKFAFGLIFRL